MIFSHYLLRFPVLRTPIPEDDVIGDEHFIHIDRVPASTTLGLGEWESKMSISLSLNPLRPMSGNLKCLSHYILTL